MPKSDTVGAIRTFADQVERVENVSAGELGIATFRVDSTGQTSGRIELNYEHENASELADRHIQSVNSDQIQHCSEDSAELADATAGQHGGDGA